MTITEAQQDIRRAFVGGGPGAFISGLLWLGAALMLRSRGVGPAFAFLFFGGMLIFPLAQVVARTVFKRRPAAKENELGRVALESTIAMIGGFFAAWLFLHCKPAYVLPISAIAVGTRYAAFRTVYGDILFWLLAALITAVGVCDILGYISFPGGTALTVAAIEIISGVLLTVRNQQAPNR